MIDRYPRCLHTCLNCKNAVMCEEYRGPYRKIIFEGCWKINDIKTPVSRGDCDKFEESPARVKRSFWEKWKGCIYVVEKGYDDYLVWQKKNAHRFIIQFKLLRCSHPRLKKTGWIFDQKRIHKHFTTAYIYKSKDPTGDIINVLPKNPFIFMSPFEFEDQIIAFVNEVIKELRDYGIIIDLSEPAEIKLQHEAIEDDLFARKVIEKGLLYFESKSVVMDANGELMNYVIKIDKSKSLHLEFEGSEAHHLTENLEAFVDDVVTGRIDRKKLREIPQKVENLKKELGNEINDIEERLTKSINHIEDTQKLLHQNQSDISENLVACMEIIKKIGEASESVARTANTIMKEVEFLTAKTQEEFGECSYLSHCS